MFDSAGLEEGQAGLAKNSDHLAGLDAEDTGGLFGSLLAEEDASDRRRMLWRVASWGAASVAAVAVAVMANQSSLGWRREQAATADLVQQANRICVFCHEFHQFSRLLTLSLCQFVKFVSKSTTPRCRQDQIQLPLLAQTISTGTTHTLNASLGNPSLAA